MNLDIHLDSGNTVSRSRYLKVHIAEEILKTLYIGKYQILIIALSGNQTAGNSRNRLSDRYTGRHQGHAGCTGGSHGSGTVRLHGLGNGTNRIGELFYRRKHRNQSLLSKSTVSDFSSSRPSGSLCFTYGISREVILV